MKLYLKTQFFIELFLQAMTFLEEQKEPKDYFLVLRENVIAEKSLGAVPKTNFWNRFERGRRGLELFRRLKKDRKLESLRLSFPKKGAESWEPRNVEDPQIESIAKVFRQSFFEMFVIFFNLGINLIPTKIDK